MPFVRAFGPKEYGAEGQNWDVVQDPRGLIYVGNNSGVLEFDGRRWRLIPLANQSAAHSLAVDAAGRVYVGGLGELGVLEPDATGQMRYVSWLDRIPGEERGFTNVYHTFSTREGVVFAAHTHIFQIASAVKVWRTSTAFSFAAQVGERLFAREGDRGLLELTRGSWQLVPGGARFSGERINAITAGWKEGTVIIATRTQGLFLLDGGSIHLFPTEADADLKRDLIYTGIRLRDGSLALGTLQGGVYVLDAQGRLRSRLTKSEGLPASTVNGLSLDSEGGLWVGTAGGIARAETGFPLTSFGQGAGLEGAPLCLGRHAGTLHVGTDVGLFRLAPGGRLLRFPAIRAQTWALLDHGPALLVANNSGVYAIQGETATLVRPSSKIAYSLCPSRRDPVRVFVGLHDGLASMRRQGTGMQGGPSEPPRPPGWVDEGKVPGIKETIRTLFETADGRLWAGTVSQGVLRVTFPASWNGEASSPTPIVERFGTAEGLPTLNWNNVHRIGGQPLFATQKGIYLFDEASQRFSPDPRFSVLFPGGSRWVYGLTEDPQGRIWTHTYDEGGSQETGAAVPGRDGSYRWDPRPLRAFANGETQAISSDPDGVMWFGNDGGLFRLDPRAPKAYDHPFRASVRRVTKAKDKLIFGGAGSGPDPTLSYADNALRFEYAAPSFDGLEANRFQVLLEGLDEDWTAWSSEAYRDYTNIREGRYRFRVRARNLYGTVSGEGTYAFRVLPPWYRTWWAYGLYALLFLSSGPSFYLWRVNQLQRRQRELEDQVARRTAEVVRQKEEIKAQHEKLIALDAFKQGLMGMIVHDLKNPLSIILNVIESHSLPSQIALLRQSARQMLTMVLNILDVQKFEDTRMTLDRRDCGLRELADEAVTQVRFLLDRKNITILTRIAPDLGARVDAEMVERVLVNLLTNAIKYTPNNGRIELIGEGDPAGAVRVEVRDEGDGIPPDKLEHVFDKFAQVQATRSGGVRSTGLGLTFCKLAVEAHGGAIGVRSEVGKGSTFWLTLPAAVSAVVSVPGHDGGSVALHPPTPPGDAAGGASRADAPPAVLTDADRALLAPFIPALRSLQIYQYSDLRRILKRPDFPSNERIDLWKKRLEAAIETENDVVFEELLGL